MASEEHINGTGDPGGAAAVGSTQDTLNPRDPSPRTGRHRFEPYPTRQIEMPDIATELAEASDAYRTGGIFDYVDYLLDLLERIANCFEVCIALAVETEDKIDKVRYEAHRIMKDVATTLDMMPHVTSLIASTVRRQRRRRIADTPPEEIWPTHRQTSRQQQRSFPRIFRFGGRSASSEPREM